MVKTDFCKTPDNAMAAALAVHEARVALLQSGHRTASESLLSVEIEYWRQAELLKPPAVKVRTTRAMVAKNRKARRG